MKRIYLFNIVAWNYRKKIGFPVCKTSEGRKERSCQSYSASHIKWRAERSFHRPTFIRPGLCVSVRMSRYWARGKFGEHERGVRVARGTALLSVNKFKHFLLNFVIKHMVNASLSIAELWMHSGDSGLLSSQQLEELRIIYWRHQRAQWEYEARSRYWIWLGQYSSYVIREKWRAID